MGLDRPGWGLAAFGFGCLSVLGLIFSRVGGGLLVLVASPIAMVLGVLAREARTSDGRDLPGKLAIAGAIMAGTVLVLTLAFFIHVYDRIE